MNEKEIQPLVVSSSPHAHSGASIRGIMSDVVIALLPVCAASLWFFGMKAFWLLVVCIGSCLATEAICRAAMRREQTLGDMSALITGILLALNLPPDLPLWQAAMGSFVAIAVAKQVFGGLGRNPFNPALVGRAFLLISCTAAMTTWSPSFWMGTDAVTTATPLGYTKEFFKNGGTIPLLWSGSIYMKMFIGDTNGCIGETSALAILIGGMYLLVRKVITWHVPLSYLVTVAVYALILQILNPASALPVPAHLFSGGLMLGAFFMATDMATTPVTNKGLVVFGVGCGILTMILRTVPSGAYPEGVSFAILIMNAFTPLINKATKPKRFGYAHKTR